MEALLNNYKPSWFYTHQIGGILASCLVPPSKQIKYEKVRMRARTSQGGLLQYDFIRASQPTKKALLIVPGVCGDS